MKSISIKKYVKKIKSCKQAQALIQGVLRGGYFDEKGRFYFHSGMDVYQAKDEEIKELTIYE